MERDKVFFPPVRKNSETSRVHDSGARQYVSIL